MRTRRSRWSHGSALLARWVHNQRGRQRERGSRDSIAAPQGLAADAPRATHREGVVRIVTASGQSSGVVITVDGDILTSAHVVTDQDVVLVSTWAGAEYAGAVVAKIEASDAHASDVR